jgi:hypothetical protein
MSGVSHPRNSLKSVGFRRVRPRLFTSVKWPVAVTPIHIIAMAFDPNLDRGVVVALRQMIDLVGARAGLDCYQAYALLSPAAELRVTLVVNGNKRIHVMLEKRNLVRTCHRLAEAQWRRVFPRFAVRFEPASFASRAGMIGSSRKLSRSPPRWIVVSPP